MAQSNCPCPTCVEGRNKAISALIAERDVLKADLCTERMIGQGVALEAMRLRSEARRKGDWIGKLQRDLTDARGELEEVKAEYQDFVAACKAPIGVDITYTKAGFPAGIQFLYP